eukprot:893062-Karenia_brevis.AAC.1
MEDTEPKTSPKHDPLAQMCNPKDESHMAQEMGWGDVIRLTAEEKSQMPEDSSCPVVEDDTPMVIDQPLGSDMCEQGFTSNEAT